MKDLRPGQLWRWDFAVGDDGWRMLELVSEERRTGLVTPNTVFLRRGTVFTVIVVDDPGPFDPNFGVVTGRLAVHDDPRTVQALWTPEPTAPCWHVVLVDGQLAWMKGPDFDRASLVGDSL